jgi:hypothetical protein
MPTIIVINGVKIVAYFRDELPPHVHAIIGKDEIRVFLGPNGVTGHRANSTVTRANVKRALIAVNDHLELCWEAWKEYSS